MAPGPRSGQATPRRDGKPGRLGRLPRAASTPLGPGRTGSPPPRLTAMYVVHDGRWPSGEVAVAHAGGVVMVR